MNLKRDRLLQINDTLSILHYELVRNVNDQSTVFDWFFNHYKETMVSKPDLQIQTMDKPASITR
ncbi:DUF4007 family protein [Paenibacillus sp. 1_12]|uniref:DUF4007 family protein n=1 Tax=Paenibacillus sp. 1_12 TaxID=1566278 RepID=UPI0011609ABE